MKYVTQKVEKKLQVVLLLCLVTAGLVYASAHSEEKNTIFPGQKLEEAAIVSTSSTETKSTTTEKPNETTTTKPSEHTYKVAFANNENLNVYKQDTEETIMHELPNPYKYGAPLVLLIVEERGEHYEVLTPERPNDDTGFVRKNEVTVKKQELKIRINLKNKLMTITSGDLQILEEKVTIGTDETPTPTGLFYINSVIPTEQRGYAPAAFGISGHSDVLTSFSGGDGQFALHGSGDATVGTAASNGCIRLRNITAKNLLKIIELGTLVEII